MDEFVKNIIQGNVRIQDQLAIIAAIEIARWVLSDPAEKQAYIRQYGTVAINRLMNE